MARNGAYIFCRDRKKGGQPDFICKYQHRDKIPMVRPAPGSRTLPVAELRYLVVLGGEHGAAPERGTTVSLVHTLQVRLLVRLALESLLEREPQNSACSTFKRRDQKLKLVRDFLCGCLLFSLFFPPAAKAYTETRYLLFMPRKHMAAVKNTINYCRSHIAERDHLSPASITRSIPGPAPH